MTRFALIAAIALVLPAAASSPDAWAEHETEVTAACLTASGLIDAKPHTKITTFSDEVGYDVLIVEGTTMGGEGKQGHQMAICLFNRATRTAVTSEMQH